MYNQVFWLTNILDKATPQIQMVFYKQFIGHQFVVSKFLLFVQWLINLV